MGSNIPIHMITGYKDHKDWSDADHDAYERDLKRRREEIGKKRELTRSPWRPCLHDGCTQCAGTGRKADGEICVHMLSCPCPKCTPYCL